MYTTGNKIFKDIRIPVCIYNNRDNYSCDEKRYHILFVESGSGSISYGGHKELFLGPILFCLSENEIPILEKGTDLVTRSIYIGPEYINQKFTFDNLRQDAEEFSITDTRERHWFKIFFERFDNYNGRINLSISEAKRMSKICYFLENQLKEQPDYYWPCRSRSYLIELLFLIEQCRYMDNQGTSLFSSGYSEEIEKIILYLYSNYRKEITIPELVRECHLNRTTLAKRFKEEVGDTIINSLIKIRINLASSMLLDTTIPVTEIMYRVGFTDLSYFNRTFRKHTNFKPSEYRQQYNTLPT